MCEECIAPSRTISRRGLVRLAGLGASGAALTVAGMRLGGGVLADDATPAATAVPPAHWTYEGEDGPEHWGDLDPTYASCSGGTEQSPIDITGPTEEDLADPEFAYQPISPLNIVNNGHTVQVASPAGNTVVIDGKTYELQQFHFHTPSEHTIDGQAQAMELHMVNKADDGSTAVVGLLLKEGQENAALKTVFEAMPVMAGPVQEVTGSVDLAAVLPEKRTTYRYLGSLTTPPCTEGVAWTLFTEPVEVSTEQIEAFRKIVGANARPVQPLNGRTIEDDTTP
jgi:carbonic anhydrase